MWPENWGLICLYNEYTSFMQELMSATGPLCSTSSQAAPRTALLEIQENECTSILLTMQATYHRFQWVVCYTSDNIGMPSEFVKWGGASNVINVGLYTHVHVWESIEEDGRALRRMGEHQGGWESIEEDGRASRRMWESIEEDGRVSRRIDGIEHQGGWESVEDRGSACMGWGSVKRVEDTITCRFSMYAW